MILALRQWRLWGSERPRIKIKNVYIVTIGSGLGFGPGKANASLFTSVYIDTNQSMFAIAVIIKLLSLAHLIDVIAHNFSYDIYSTMPVSSTESHSKATISTLSGAA